MTFTPLEKQLIRQVNNYLVDEVGPIGEMLAEDALKAWRRHKWSGPAAIRRYIHLLADQIDHKQTKNRFQENCSAAILELN